MARGGQVAGGTGPGGDVDNRAVVYRNLNLMLGAGLPAIQAFRNAGKGRGAVGRAMREVGEQIRQGQTIAEAMRRHPSIFGPLDVTVVHAGEESGGLPGSFKMLAEWYDFRRQLGRQVRKGSYLPLLLAHMMALLLPVVSMGLGSMSGRQPQFDELPWLMLRNLLIIWVPLVALWALFTFTSAHSPIRRGLDRALLWVPLVGGAMRQLALSRYFWAYHVLAKAGLDAVQTNHMAVGVVGNASIAAKLEAGTQSARAGNPVSEGLAGALPSEYLEIWQVGEQTGEVEESARRLAEVASARAAERLDAITTWLPRLAYLGLAIYLVYVIMRFASGYANTLNGLMKGI